MKLSKEEYLRVLKITMKVNTKTFHGPGNMKVRNPQITEREFFTCPTCMKECKSSNRDEMQHIRRCGLKPQGTKSQKFFAVRK